MPVSSATTVWSMGLLYVSREQRQCHRLSSVRDADADTERHFEWHALILTVVIGTKTAIDFVLVFVLIKLFTSLSDTET